MKYLQKTSLKVVATLLLLWTAKSHSQAKIQIHGGLPIGKTASSSIAVSLGADIAYTFEVSNNFEAGFTVGYTHFIGKKYSYDMPYWYDYGLGGGVSYGPSIEGRSSFGMIPLAATAHITVSDPIFIGADVGYAFSTSKNGGGSFYYQPKFGMEFGVMEAFLSWKGYVNTGSHLGSINLGLAYRF